MRISDVVRRKGDRVFTVRPDDTVESLLALLEEHRIGALVVSEDGETVSGIVSERDVVWRLASDGVGILKAPISQIMTTDVRTCDLDTHIDAVVDLLDGGSAAPRFRAGDGRSRVALDLGQERIQFLDPRRGPPVMTPDQAGEHNQGRGREQGDPPPLLELDRAKGDQD